MSNKGSARKCAKCGTLVEIPLDKDVRRLVDALGQPLCADCFEPILAAMPKPGERVVPQRETKYVFTEGMGEISGFGGGYEQTCRNMLAAGLEWLDAHPEADPSFKGMKGVFGIIVDDNADAKGLSDAVVSGSGGDCTGAMHQAVVGACMFIRKNGWARYCEEMKKRDE